MLKQIIVLFVALNLASDCLNLAHRELAAAEPILRVESSMPTNFVTGVAFSPAGGTLFAGGWDKVVRVWNRDQNERYVPDPAATFRLPVGPGLEGAINALAVSPDGEWLAVGGLGVMSAEAGFYGNGKIIPATALSAEDRLQRGTIHIFHTKTRETFSLRGHWGEVLDLEFAPGAVPVMLASAAREWDDSQKQTIGAVRLWNLADRKQQNPGIALPAPRNRPHLAVRRSGPESNQLQVAIAWNEQDVNGTFRLWDVAVNRVQAQTNDGSFSSATALTDNAILSTGMRTMAGRSSLQGVIRFWEIQNNSLVESVGRRLPLMERSGQELMPYAMTLVSNAHAVVVAAELKLVNNSYVPGDNMRLILTSLDNSPPGRVRREVTLWKLPKQTIPHPVVTVSPDGSQIAVTGAPDHQIQVFNVRQLLEGNKTPLTIHGEGNSIQSIAFVRKENELGLRLGSSDDESTRVYSLPTRELTTAGAWRDVTPTADEYEVTLKPGVTAAESLEFRHGDDRREIRLPVGYRHVGHAICPAGDVHQSPLLAIAVENRGQPGLVIYDGATGRQLRQCSGHEQSVRAMAFSDDHRFLASADAGNIVCVWNLVDLDEIRGQHGLLTGIEVAVEPNAAAGQLVVSQVDPKSPLANQIAAGDRLLGYRSNAQVVTWKTERDFYDTWWQRRPGQTTTILRQRARISQDVAVVPEQAVDERKPLFSLLQMSGENADSGWIVWSPLGPFDSSDALVERQIGWHFNGDRKSASVFAPIDQYRREYFRSHLAQQLIDNPKLIPPAPELKRPDLTLSIPGRDISTESSGANWLDGFSSIVRLWIDPEFPLSAIAAVDLHIDDAKIGSFAPVGNRNWEATIDTTNWSRATRQISAVVRTNESLPRSFAQSLPVEYRIPAPSITVETEIPAATREAEIQLDSRVALGRPDESVTVKLTRSDTQETIATWKLDRDQPVTTKIPLIEGTNRFELVAVNEGATDASRPSESTRYTIQVTREMTDVPSPLITLDSFRQIDPISGNEEPLKLSKGAELIVDHPRLRVAGSIEATQDLATAHRLNEDGSEIELRNFQPGQQPRATIDEEVSLRPGLQTLTIRAKTKAGKSVELDLPVEYRPALPVVRIINPASGHVVSEFQESPHVELVADLEIVEGQPEFKVDVLVNSIVAPTSPRLDVAKKTLRAEIPLSVGDNVIQLRVHNSWKQEFSESVIVVYDPPPQLADTKVTERSSGIRDVQLSINSPTEVDSIEVDGHRLRADDYQIRRDRGKYEVTIPDMPTVLGKAPEIRLGRSGSEQWLRHTLPVAKENVVVQAPVVEIVDPGMSIVVEDAQYTVHYIVRSAQPIQQVDVWRDGNTVDRVDVPSSARNDDGQFEFRGTAKVDLRAGSNSIEVSARGRGSVGSKMIAISRLARPIEVEIDGLVSAGKDVVAPIRTAGGAVSFPAQTTGEVWLEGSVKWGNPNDPRLTQPEYAAHVWVNGFQQVPANLEPPTGLERKFRARLILNQPTNNVVEVALPDLQTEIGSLRHFYVDCSQPIRDQRLHLLVVAVDESDATAAELISRAKTAVGGDKKPTSRASQTFVYGPLTSSTTTKRRVRTEVLRIAEVIELRNRNNPGTDVVMIYYQGAELVQQPTGFFLTTRQTKDAATDALLREPEYLRLFAVGSDMLRELVEIGPGAYLLMLDVKRAFGEASPDKPVWPRDSRAAVLRHAWLRERQMPADARLISALEQTMPKVRELEQVLAELDSNYDRLAAQYPSSLRFEHQVPNTLRTLQLGQR